MRRGIGRGVQGDSDESSRKWKPPEQELVKVNVDGAFSNLLNTAACGGILRNAAGDFIRGYAVKLEKGDCVTAEIWACLHGMKIAWDMGYRQIVLESDSSDVIMLLSNEGHETRTDVGIITEAMNMLSRDWRVQFCHVSRWANSAADHLAKEGLSAMSGIQFLDHAHRA